jgi:hypothetical protein
MLSDPGLGKITSILITLDRNRGRQKKVGPHYGFTPMFVILVPVSFVILPKNGKTVPVPV